MIDGRKRATYPLRWCVWCIRFDGTRKLFDRYGTRQQADTARSALLRQGMAAEVERIAEVA